MSTQFFPPGATSYPDQDGRRALRDVQTLANESQWRNFALNRIANNLKGSVINKGLLLAMGLVALDCLLVAHYQPDVALALLRWTPPLSLLVGAMVNLLPVAVPAMVVVAVIRAVLRLWTATGEQGPVQLQASFTSLLVALATVLGSFLLVPVGAGATIMLLASLSLAAAGVVMVHTAGSSVHRRASTARNAGQFIGVAALCGAVCAAGLVVVPAWGAGGAVLQRQVAQPWMPAEVMTWKGAAPSVGYVLSTSDGWVAVLDESTRRITLRPAADLQTRQVCNVGQAMSPRIRLVPRTDPQTCP